jgi:hypothetical protein
VYDTKAGYGWNTWSKWSLEDIANKNWGTNTPLRRWPAGIKQMRDYFEDRTWPPRNIAV